VHIIYSTKNKSSQVCKTVAAGSVSFLMPAPPLWLQQSAEFIYSLHNLGKKSETQPDIFQLHLNEILSAFDGYTNGFIRKVGKRERQRSGGYIGRQTPSQVPDIPAAAACLQDNLSIFTAEPHRYTLIFTRVWTDTSKACGKHCGTRRSLASCMKARLGFLRLL
jgi:hypothetical protein